MKNVIFDFDGTIVESLNFVIDMYLGWYPNNEHIKNIDVEKLREMPLTKVIEELRIRPWKVPALIVKGRHEMNKNIYQLKMVPGVENLIKSLDNNGVNLYIASSNSVKNINKYMKHKEMRSLFKKIYGSVGILGKAKALNKIIDKNKLNRNDTYYIGDETRDIKASRKAGIHSIGVTWGYNGKQIMQNENPEFLASKPSDILRIILP